MRRIYCWVATHVGHVRDQNEDGFAVSASAPPTGAGTWEGELADRHAWALVADGMGGHAAGEVASRLAVEVLQLFVSKSSAVAELPDALASADWAIREAMAQKPALKGMGTTVCGVIVEENALAAFNVGDSRIYLLESGALRQLSEDHVVHGHMLTQCLGGSSAARVLEPCVSAQELPALSRVLLCTDGLTDLVPDERIQELLAQSDRPAEILVDAALDAGGVDNVTVVVLEIQSSGPA